IALSTQTSRCVSITQWVHFAEQFLQPTPAFLRGDKLEGEPRWRVVSNAGAVAVQMFEHPRPQIVGLADVHPQGIEEAVNTRILGCINDERIAVPRIFNVMVIGKWHRVSVLLAA